MKQVALAAAAATVLIAGVSLAQINAPVAPGLGAAPAAEEGRGGPAGFVLVQAPDELSLDDLIGRPIYNHLEEILGTATNLLFTADGQISVVIMSVGGFLGIGATEVGIAYDRMGFRLDQDGNVVWIFNATAEEVANAEEFTMLQDDQRNLTPMPAAAPGLPVDVVPIPVPVPVPVPTPAPAP